MLLSDATCFTGTPLTHWRECLRVVFQGLATPRNPHPQPLAAPYSFLTSPRASIESNGFGGSTDSRGRGCMSARGIFLMIIVSGEKNCHLSRCWVFMNTMQKRNDEIFFRCRFRQQGRGLRACWYWPSAKITHGSSFFPSEGWCRSWWWCAHRSCRPKIRRA